MRFEGVQDDHCIIHGLPASWNWRPMDIIYYLLPIFSALGSAIYRLKISGAIIVTQQHSDCLRLLKEFLKCAFQFYSIKWSVILILRAKNHIFDPHPLLHRVHFCTLYKCLRTNLIFLLHLYNYRALPNHVSEIQVRQEPRCSPHWLTRSLRRCYSSSLDVGRQPYKYVNSQTNRQPDGQIEAETCEQTYTRMERGRTRTRPGVSMTVREGGTCLRLVTRFIFTG